MSFMENFWNDFRQLIPPFRDYKDDRQAPLHVQSSLADPDTMIRLLLLFPGTDGPLRCSTFDVPLAAAPDYDAISYHWGDPTPTHKLWIGPRLYPIATSIFEVLFRVRDEHKFSILWIDGVCISQTDAEEKSRQIQLLRQIFHQAKFVWIWLGPTMDGSERLPDLFQRITRAQQNFYRKLGDIPNLLQTKMPAALYESFGLPNEEDLEWNAVPAFFARRWFRRVWVIQEVVLAQEPIVMCGAWHVSWRTLSQCMWAILRLDLPRVIDTKARAHDYEVADAIEIFKFIDALRYSLRESYRWEFVHVQHRLKVADATDDRDKIYGLYGLAVAFGREVPKPDYRKDTATVYKEYALHSIGEGHGIHILYNCFDSDDFRRPTWVPNWKSRAFPRPRLAPDPQQTCVVNPAFRAGEFMTSSIRVHETSDSILVVSGVLVDSIKTIGIEPKLPAKSKAFYDSMYVVAACAVELEDFWGMRGSHVYQSGEQRDEVVWRTMILNSIPGSQKEALPIYGQYYKTFRTVCSTALKKFDRGWPSGKLEDFLAQDISKLSADANTFMIGSLESCEFRRRCLTTNGWLGQVPLSTLPGDVIFIPCGSAIPLVLRPRDRCFRIIGGCYVHGVMKGEAFDMPGLSVSDVWLE